MHSSTTGMMPPLFHFTGSASPLVGSLPPGGAVHAHTRAMPVKITPKLEPVSFPGTPRFMVCATGFVALFLYRMVLHMVVLCDVTLIFSSVKKIGHMYIIAVTVNYCEDSNLPSLVSLALFL